MKLFSRMAVVGATALVALSLPAHPVGTPRLWTRTCSGKSTTTTKPMQLAQRAENPAFFKRSKKKEKKRK